MPVGTTRLAVILHMLKDQPWAMRVKRDIDAVLENHLTIHAEYSDAGGDPAVQVRLLEEYLANGFDACIVAPIDAEQISPVLRRYQAANVPVIVIGSDIADEKLCQAVILGDHRQFGREVGTFLTTAMDGVGRLVEILGIVASSVTTDRSQGFRESLAEHPQMQIIDTCVGDWTYDRARREFAEVLSRHERIDAVFAHNDEMASAALDSAAAVGREEEMLVAGIDALPSSIRLVSQGRLAATFLYPSPGKNAVYALLAVLNHEQCLKRVLLHTWPFRSNSRVRAWREGRR
jgi:ribose transport system substrate-binding protein